MKYNLIPYYIDYHTLDSSNVTFNSSMIEDTALGMKKDNLMINQIHAPNDSPYTHQINF